MWGGYAYGRELDGRPARAEMETAYRRIAVAAKNTDTREHDIADSDDYFQYHGGMVATVRALKGAAPEAYIGDSTRPETVRTRTLMEETSRVFRARVVNPRWIAAMRRHGYKGAFELAATVDYLFGYDATTGRGRRLDVRQAHRDLRHGPGEPRLPPGGQPLGAAWHRGASAGGRVTRYVGRAGSRRAQGAPQGVPGDGGRAGGEGLRLRRVLPVSASSTGQHPRPRFGR